METPHWKYLERKEDQCQIAGVMVWSKREEIGRAGKEGGAEYGRIGEEGLVAMASAPGRSDERRKR